MTVDRKIYIYNFGINKTLESKFFVFNKIFFISVAESKNLSLKIKLGNWGK